MLRVVLNATGLGRALGDLKLRLEDRAEEAVTQVKGVAVRIAIAVALAIAAVFFVTLAIVAGLIALYAYLQPLYGVIPALGIVGGLLIVLAVVLLLVARSVGAGSSKDTASKPAAATSASDIRRAPSDMRAYRARESEAAREAVDSVMALATGERPRRRGNGRLDPELDTDAATLIETGDRRTVFAVLGAVAAMGWLLGRTMPPPAGR